MRARLKCENPEDIEYTITMTMKAKEWESLRNQLHHVWPSSWLTHRVDDLLSQARKIYWSEEEA
jgi:hypothetical protein